MMIIFIWRSQCSDAFHLAKFSHRFLSELSNNLFKYDDWEDHHPINEKSSQSETKKQRIIRGSITTLL